MKVAINSTDNSHTRGYYSKISGLIKAAQGMGLDYGLYELGKEYDVVINWEPWEEKVIEGKRFTIVWAWDTFRHSMSEYATNISAYQGQLRKMWYESDNYLLFRAHATIYHPSDISPLGRKVYWMPPAVDEEVFKRAKDDKREYDISWVGEENRTFVYRRILEVLKNFFNVLEVKESLPYKEYIDCLRKGKMILNMPRAFETNKRVMEAMALGPALMPWAPTYTIFAVPDKHFVSYGPISWKDPEFLEDMAEMVKKVRYYLNRPKLLARIEKEGRKLVEDNFTFEKQVERIENILRFNLAFRNAD